MSNPGDTEFQPPKFCPQCGSPVTRSGAKFCSTCGRNFAQPGTDPVAPQANPPVENYVETPVQSAPQAVYGQSLRQQQTQPNRWEMTTPREIKPVTSAWYTRDELRIMGIFIVVAYISHIMRYLILFNKFPDIPNLLWSIPLYSVTVPLIFSFQKYIFRNNGVQVTMKANKFDFNRSMVFSSFFLTLLPPRMIIDKENSNIPEKVYTPQAGDYGISYQELSAAKYIGSKVRPKMHFWSSAMVLLLGLLSIYMYFNTPSDSLQQVIRLVSLYISSFVMVELAPIFGRNNEKSAAFGRFRTLALFFLSLIFFIIALLGETFFVALQQRVPT